MKKRIIAMALCLVFVLTMLVSCGDDYYDMAKDYINQNELRPAEPNVTLNMYIPCESEIDSITLSSMQSEFNYITEAKYKTRVIFHMIPKAEYLEKITAQANYASEHALDELDKTPASVNDNYPRENDIQFDIFVSLNKSMMDSMIGAGYVTDLTQEMTSTYNQKLFNLNDSSSVSDIIYQNATWTVNKQVDGDTAKETVYYGVPSNFVIGEYTYYVINKANADAHYFSKDETVSIETRVTKLEEAIDKNTQIENKDDYKAETVKTITGDYGTRFEIDANSYYVYVKQTPVLDISRLYEGMFCISSMCRYKDRAMSVIAELFTNKDLHTTLQYGSENLTYRYTLVDGVKTVELIDGAPAYNIDAKYTGNVAVLHPCPEKGYGNNFVEYLDKQNKETMIP